MSKVCLDQTKIYRKALGACLNDPDNAGEETLAEYLVQFTIEELSEVIKNHYRYLKLREITYSGNPYEKNGFGGVQLKYGEDLDKALDKE